MEELAGHFQFGKNNILTDKVAGLVGLNLEEVLILERMED